MKSIPRSSVVCFGVFSATVSVNYYTSISLDGFKGLKLFKSRRRTPIISNQRVLTKIKENELKNSKIHALIYINPLCVRVCKDWTSEADAVWTQWGIFWVLELRQKIKQIARRLKLRSIANIRTITFFGLLYFIFKGSCPIYGIN